MIEVDREQVGRLRTERDSIALDGREIPRVTLHELQLRSAHQRQGVGTAIIRMLQQEMTEASGVLELGVEHANSGARRLYDRLGFVPISKNDKEVEMRWPPEGTAPAASRYRHSLMRLRESARALIIDPDDRVLLVHFDWPGLEPAGGFWANPGGGVEPGESRLDAIQRELREETGLRVDHLGPEIWTKTAMFEMSDWDGQIDHIHLYRVAHFFEPAPEMTRAQLAAEHVHGVRWWSPDEIASGSAIFAPRSLPRLLADLRRRGVPTVPIVLEGF